jgi:hypothetical protein
VPTAPEDGKGIASVRGKKLIPYYTRNYVNIPGGPRSTSGPSVRAESREADFSRIEQVFPLWYNHIRQNFPAGGRNPAPD